MSNEGGEGREGSLFGVGQRPGRRIVRAKRPPGIRRVNGRSTVPGGPTNPTGGADFALGTDSDARTQDQSASTSKVTTDTNIEDMKEIFRELFDSEIRFMKGLGEERLKKMCGGSWDPRFCAGRAPINHFCTAGEIGLVLAGLKPCSVVQHYSLREFGQLLHTNVIRPWYEKYFSEDSGFICELGSPGCAWYWSDKGKADVAGGASMFINLNHSDASYAIGILKTPNKKPTTMEELRKVFGFPASMEGGIDSLIEYQFQNPEEIYKIKNCCCSPCLDYFAIESDAASVGRHFRRCREAMLKLGYSLALDVYHQDHWSPKAAATAWFHAAGCDMDECLDMMKADQVWMRCCGHRKQWVIRELYNLAGDSLLW